MKIVVALDGSEKGEAVLEPSLKLARAAQAEVVLLSVLNPLVDAVDVTAPSTAEAMRQVTAQRHKYLEEKASSFADIPAQPLVELVPHGEDVPGCIARVAQELEADILVVASKRSSGVIGLILGSVVQSLLHISPCPVLVVRPE